MKKANSTIRHFLAALMLLFCAGTIVAQNDIVRDFNAGGFAGEVGWEIIEVATGTVVDCEAAGGAAPNGAPTTLSVPAGTYEVRGFDSFGDTWNGGSLVVTQNCATLFDTNGPTGFNLFPPVNTCNGVASPVNGTSTQILGTFDVVNSATCNLTCPANITTATTPGLCGAVVAYTIGSAGCTSTSANFPSGSLFPQGETEVIVCAGATGAEGTCSFTVTVNDEEPPTLNCPSDITINLGPGECSTFFSYEVTAEDNCPLDGLVTLTQNPPNNDPAQAIDPAQSLNCGFTQTKFGRVFGGPGTGPFNIEGLEVGIRVGGGNYTFQVYELTSGTAPAAGNANLAPIGSPYNEVLPAVAQQYVSVTFPMPKEVSADAYFFVEIISEQGNFTMGNIALPDDPATPSYIAAGACGLPDYGTFASVGFANLSLAFNVVASLNLEITQTEGLPSGSEFGIGTVTNCFELADVGGNLGTCCFDVTVEEFPDATQNLTCNDHVQISLDENCEATIGADDILEGGPYGCYDTRYTVQVLGPLGNVIPQPLGNSAIGTVWTVKVIDNETGQSCWGSITVEDKLPPVIECLDYEVDCSEDLNAPQFLEPSPVVAVNAEPLETVNAANNGGASGGAVHFEIENLTAFPIEITELGMKISGATNVDVYTKDGTFAGFQNNAGAWTLTAVADANTGPFAGGVVGGPVITPAPVSFMIPPGVTGITLHTPDAAQSYTNGNGGNQTFNDGNIEIRLGSAQNALWAGLFQPRVWNGYVQYKIDIDAVPPMDNCGPVSTSFEDSFVDGACGGPSGTLLRTWTATDPSGNESQCVSTITLARPAVDDVEIPGNIKWTCTQYDIFPNIIEAIGLHPFITDCDDTSDLLDATCYSASCDDIDTPGRDNPNLNSTTNGGGCPGFGLDDADVLALTGSGYPSVGGRPLVSICEIGVEYEDIIVQECVGTFKIVRQWTIIDWCSNPIDVRQENQVIKVVDEEAPIIELFGVDGQIESNYGNTQIPALGNLGNPNAGGGCGQAPQNTGGTVFTALVELPGTGSAFNPDQFTQLELESVLLTLSHDNVEDLDIFLKGPSNKVIELSTNNGINGVGYYKTKFVDDPAVPSIRDANSPFTGHFRPEGTDDTSCGGFNGTVATLDDMIANWQSDALGTWELIIFDENEDNIGEMVEWKLNFSFGDVTIDVYDAAASGSIHTVCEGSVHVPPIQDCVDNCSGVDHYVTQLWTIDANGDPEFQIGTIDGNGGYFSNVPLFQTGLPARYVVRYFAVDGCKNQSFIDMNIRLRDKVPPVAICDEITEISITNNGQGTGTSCSTLYAEDLDDGSYDNCSPIYFLMAKMDDSVSDDIYNRCYYPTRDFCCDDLGEQTVILMVLDQDPTTSPGWNTTFGFPNLGCDEPTPTTPSLFLSPNGITSNVPGTQNLVPINFNTCMVTVQVTDKLPPVLVQCPASERISCDLYAANFETQLANATTPEEECAVFNAFGQATYFDNCVANVTCSVSFNLDQCLEGTIRRTWTAEDDAGNSNSSQNCNQTIFVDHVSDFVVEFPQNRDGTPGHLPAVECGDDVPDFGEPEIFYETCELVAVSYEDEVFTDVVDACYKIVRQWTVINWCVVGDEIDQEVVEDSEEDLRNAGCLAGGFPPECDLDGDGDCDSRTFRDSWAICNLPDAAHATQNTNPDTDNDSDPWDGYITYQQVIKVNDTEDPVFTNGCEIPDVCISDNTCAATVLLPTPDIDECSEHVTFSYEIEIGGTTLFGAGPYLNVAPGQYPVRYVASDNCNNQTSCETVLNVVDCKKPTPYCKNGIVVELMVVDPAMVEVWASDLNDNSFDNCPGALKFSFSADVDDIGRTYTCDDLGQNEVEMWVTDAAGNQDFCVTSVIIQANMDQCTDDPLIAGQTATEQGEGVQDVTVNINSPGGWDTNVTTDVDGNYVDAVTAGGDYTVTPVHDVDPLNGVTTYDLVVISKHILGVDLLDSPYQMIAADANKSNSITTFDLVSLRKLILFIDTEFPNNTSWRFVDKDHVFANPTNPFATSFPEVINVNNLTTGQLVNDFVAVKIGDVNGSAAVNFADAEDRTMVGDLVLNADDAVLNEGETYTVEFKATEFAVTGYQFTLNFDNDALTFEGIAPALADASNFGTTMVNEGVITTSWNSNEVNTLATDDVVFGLTFTAKQGGRLSDLLSINSRYTVAEAYNAEAELLNVALSFNNTVVADGFELYQNTPNPFASNTIIGFYLPEATSATLTISDVQGKVVKVLDQEFNKGYNQVELKRSELNASGVLYYRLDTESDSATRMMILVD